MVPETILPAGELPKKREEKDEDALKEEGEGRATERVAKGHKMAEEMSFLVV